MDALGRQARRRPARAAAAQLHPGGRVPVHGVERARLRLGRPRRRRHEGRRAGRLRRAPRPPDDARTPPRPPSGSASACRRTSRCAGWRRRGCSPRSTTRPAAGRPPRCGSLPTAKVQVVTGTSPHGQGHETCLVDDRRRQARASTPTTSTCSTATPRSRRSVSTPTARARCRSAAWRSPWRATRSSTRRSQDRRPPARGERRRSRVRRPVSFTVKGSPDKSMPLAAIAFEAFTAHNLPDGLEPNLEAQVTYDPPNFSWPFGTHMCVVEVDTETGGVDVLQVRRRRRLRRAGQPADRRRPGARRRRSRGSPRRCSRRRSYDSDGNLQTTHAGRVHGPGGLRRPADDARPHGHAVADQPARREGHRRGGHDRGRAGGDQRHRRRPQRPRRPRRTDARQPEERLERDPRSHLDDPRQVRLRPGRLGRGGDQPDRRARRRGQVPRRRTQPAAADEAPARPAERARRHRPAVRPVVHPRRRRPHRHRRPDPSHGRRELRPARRARAAARPRDEPRRRSAGASPGHDRRLDRPRRPGVGPARHDARPRGHLRRPGAERHGGRSPASEFYEGFLTSTLAADELLVEIRVPKMQGAGWGFQKFNRRAQDWAIVGVAAWRRNGDSGVALVNMASVPRSSPPA